MSLVFRRPSEDDHARVVAAIDEWWGGRRLRDLLPRLWLQHFNGTSWIAEDPDGRLRGFVVAFLSQDDPATGYVHIEGAPFTPTSHELIKAVFDATRGAGKPGELLPALDMVASRADSKGVTIQVFRPAGRPQYATA